MNSLLPLITSICFNISVYQTKEAKVTCIETYTNCLVDNKGDLDYCKKQEEAWNKRLKQMQ